MGFQTWVQLDCVVLQRQNMKVSAILTQLNEFSGENLFIYVTLTTEWGSERKHKRQHFL